MTPDDGDTTRFFSTFSDISEALKAKLLSVAVPTLSATMYKKGFSSRLLAGLTPLNPKAAKFCGPAWTVRGIPVREDIRDAVVSGALPSQSRVAFEEAPAGSVLVCGTGGNPRIALIGDIITTSLIRRGLAGIVVDTGLSDAALIKDMRFPVVSAGSAPLSSYAAIMVLDNNLPIGIDGVAVFPGDVMVGDANGVVCIPRYLADAVADAAIAQERLEEFILERVRGGASLDGTYPPDAAARVAYEAWCAAKG